MKKLVIAAFAAAAISGFGLAASPASAAISPDLTIKTETAQTQNLAKEGSIQLARHWRGHRWHRRHHWRGGYGRGYGYGYGWGPRCVLRRIHTYYGVRFRRVCFY